MTLGILLLVCIITASLREHLLSQQKNSSLLVLFDTWVKFACGILLGQYDQSASSHKCSVWVQGGVALMDAANLSLTPPVYFVLCHMCPFLRMLLCPNFQSRCTFCSETLGGMVLISLINIFIKLKWGSMNYNVTINWQGLNLKALAHLNHWLLLPVLGTIPFSNCVVSKQPIANPGRVSS